MSRVQWTPGTKRWTIGFAVVTVTAIVWELWAGVDGNPDTVPWTDYIVMMPVELFALLGSGFVGWFLVHFYRRYQRKHRSNSDSAR